MTAAGVGEVAAERKKWGADPLSLMAIDIKPGVEYAVVHVYNEREE